MKAVMIMFDSLNRHMLPPYGGSWVKAPNFERLAEKTVVFDNCYAGSLPCMPARREIHTGRYNFLHRSWGPMEPFDDSMPEILKRNGVYSHLTSDHLHYWEDGGCTYHTRYSTWEITRGQEGDPWKGEVDEPEIPEHVPTHREHMGGHWRQDWINRKYMQAEEAQPQAKTFAKGLEFIEKNHTADNWFLHIETFDPHEPYFTQQKYKDLYEHDYQGAHFDWPNYYMVTETPEQVAHVRYENAALVSMCDAYLGKVLDAMDAHDMWKDTMLILNTDHGFLLGEHGWWAKIVQPLYNEVAHTPLFIWDPRCRARSERRQSLVQTIDLAPTILDFFNLHVPESMQGRPLGETVSSDTPVRAAALFGVHGGHVNITDGRYVYMRAPKDPGNTPLFDYTLMPTHMNSMFGVDELQDIQLEAPFPFTRGCRTMKIEASTVMNQYIYGSILFDLAEDPGQEEPLVDAGIEKQMIKQMVEMMAESEAPEEQYFRLGLPRDGWVKEGHLDLKERPAESRDVVGNTAVTWVNKGKSCYYSLLSRIPSPEKRQYILGVEEFISSQGLKEIDESQILDVFMQIVPGALKPMMIFTASIIKAKGK